MDLLDDDEPRPDVDTPGVPPSLGRAIEEWLAQLKTTDEEIAAFLGWTVEKIRGYR
ncbi:hypothetical protein ABZ570_03420 [Micromonospora sp. NPDC007271]|uniref:hypothetical protein n=1 Tax=Micromonospora sp. NPDC007271 TaxID=3154587 RepID=UPI0033E18A9A